MDFLFFAQKYQSLPELFDFLVEIDDYHTTHGSFVGYNTQQSISRKTDNDGYKYLLHGMAQGSGPNHVFISLTYMEDNHPAYDQDLEDLQADFSLQDLQTLIEILDLVDTLDVNILTQSRERF